MRQSPDLALLREGAPTATDREGGLRRPDQATLTRFRSVEVAVRARMLAGDGLGEVEEELINPAALDSERKAVLWLLAWSLLPRAYQLAEVEAHIALLSRPRRAS
jgi:hypothetical protein